MEQLDITAIVEPQTVKDSKDTLNLIVIIYLKRIPHESKWPLLFKYLQTKSMSAFLWVVWHLRVSFQHVH